MPVRRRLAPFAAPPRALANREETAGFFPLARPVRGRVPVAKANSLLDLVPGNSLLTKTGVVATGVGLTAVAISKEFLLLHPETIVLGAFAGMVVFLHQQVTPIVANELDTRADEIRKHLNAAGDARKANLLNEIEATKGNTETVGITKEIFAISKDITVLQAQIRERELRRAIGTQIKFKLDYIAQLEAQKRQLEQQKVLEALRARVAEAIQDPKFQNELLKKVVVDLESLAVSK